MEEVPTFKPQRRCTVCREFGHNIAKCTDPRAEQERARRAALRKRTVNEKNLVPPKSTPTAAAPVTLSKYTEERLEQDRAYERFMEEDRIRSEELEIQEAIRLSEELTQKEKEQSALKLIENYKKRAKTNNFPYALQFRCPSEVLVFNFSPEETWGDIFQLLISHKSIQQDIESEEWILCDPLDPGNPIVLAEGSEILSIQEGTLRDFFQKTTRASLVVSVQ